MRERGSLSTTALGVLAACAAAFATTAAAKDDLTVEAAFDMPLEELLTVSTSPGGRPS